MSETSGLSLLFAVLVDAWASWHVTKINAAAVPQLEALRKTTSRQKEALLKAAQIILMIICLCPHHVFADNFGLDRYWAGVAGSLMMTPFDVSMLI